MIDNYWLFGLNYSKIQRHTEMDDRNIPDFTGVRAKDSTRDIMEIKPPFLPLFNKKDEFRSEFHKAINQAEIYLNFARDNADYLKREKGLRFHDPKCILIIGYSLSEEQLKKFRQKGRNTPIDILTYNDILSYMKKTIEFIKRLKEK